MGHEGLNNLLVAYEDKSAQAVCTFAYCEGPGHEPLIFEGRVTVSALSIIYFESFIDSFQGKIVPPRGPNVFGKSAIAMCDV